MANDEAVLVASVSKCKERNGMHYCTTTNSPSYSAMPERGEVIERTVAKGLGSCSSKRKRPPKIEIPKILREIPCPVSSGCNAQEQRGSGFAVFSLKGKKKFMEDSQKIFSFPNGDKAFFGVYDGHGGSMAADFVAENLHLKIFEMLNRSSDHKSEEEAVMAGYLKTDEEFLKQGLGSGACCVTALIGEKVIVVSNLGDCRAVLCRGRKAEALTTDHRPSREDERRRIEDNGGYVEFHRGTWRIHGSLAVSRSIGDAHLKQWVLAQPESKVVPLITDMQYLVLASDGLWEQIGNQEAVDIVMQSCEISTKQTTSSLEKESPRVARVKSKWIFLDTSLCKYDVEKKQSEAAEVCGEIRSPPCKSRRTSSAKRMKVKEHTSDENQVLIEKLVHGDGLLAACKDLAGLAVARGRLDDITIIVVDLSYYRH